MFVDRRLQRLVLTACCLFLVRTAVAAEPLTLERIFGTKPILTPLPEATWVGDSKGISMVHEVKPAKEGEARDAFVIRDVPSGKFEEFCASNSPLISHVSYAFMLNERWSSSWIVDERVTLSSAVL